MHPACRLWQVILVSARDALLSRLVLGNRAQKADLTRFRQLAFGRRASAKSDEADARQGGGDAGGQRCAGARAQDLLLPVWAERPAQAAQLHR